jgi:hypothetical protein
MSKLEYRGSIVLAAIVVGLLSPRGADAQVMQGPPREPGGFVNEVATGVAYDRANQKAAVHRFQYLQAKLRRDVERNNSVAASRDARQIENVRYRMSMNEWLIQKNSLMDPCFVPAPLRLDPMTCAAIANASRPPEAPFISAP